MKRNLLLVMLAIAASSTLAGEIVGADLARQEAVVSMRDPSIFTVEGRAITKVGTIQGEVEHVFNPANGNAHIWFPVDTDKPALVVLTDDAGVDYMLLLTPKDIPGERFVVAPGVPVNKPSGVTLNNRSPSRLRAIKTMVRRMYQPSSKGRELAVDVPLWNETIFVLRAKHTEVGLVGERYSLCNASSNEMVLSERELDRPSVVAVSIEHHVLSKAQCTDVVIVHEARGRQ